MAKVTYQVNIQHTTLLLGAKRQRESPLKEAPLSWKLSKQELPLCPFVAYKGLGHENTDSVTHRM